jgi:hypothetical protein
MLEFSSSLSFELKWFDEDSEFWLSELELDENGE